MDSGKIADVLVSVGTEKLPSGDSRKILHKVGIVVAFPNGAHAIRLDVIPIPKYDTHGYGHVWMKIVPVKQEKEGA